MFNDIVVRGMMITVEQPPVHLLMQLEGIIPIVIASRIEVEDEPVEVADKDDGYNDGVVWQALVKCHSPQGEGRATLSKGPLPRVVGVSL